MCWDNSEELARKWTSLYANGDRNLNYVKKTRERSLWRYLVTLAAGCCVMRVPTRDRTGGAVKYIHYLPCFYTDLAASSSSLGCQASEKVTSDDNQDSDIDKR